MADLDDFFKKRDKKKKTTKTKFSTLDITDEFAKQIEVTSIDVGGANDGDYATETSNNIESNQTNAVSSSATFTSHPNTNTNTTGGGDGNPDEEWKPFDSEENRDYSGLRINQNWKIEDEEENNEDDYADESEKKVACPWAMGGKQQQQQQQQQPPASAEDKKEEINNNQSNETVDNKESSESAAATSATSTSQPTATATSAPAAGAYVPPHLRNKASSDKQPSTANTTTTQSSSAVPGAYVPPHLRNKADNSSTSSGGGSSGGGAFTNVTRKSNKAQPNINDTLEFPTLDSAITSETGDKITTNGDDRFDYPKRGARVEPKSGGNMIDLENKFNALSNN